MPSPCKTCYLLKESKDNSVCKSCEKRINRVREINSKYPSGPTNEEHIGHGSGGVIESDVYERRRRDLG